MMLYRLMTKYDTLQYRKIMYQFKMLMHHSDPQAVGDIRSVIFTSWPRTLIVPRVG